MEWSDHSPDQLSSALTSFADQVAALIRSDAKTKLSELLTDLAALSIANGLTAGIGITDGAPCDRHGGGV